MEINDGIIDKVDINLISSHFVSIILKLAVRICEQNF